MRLTFVIASLSGGGAERVATYMANHWANKGWHINIITVCHGRKPKAYWLDPRVTHRDLDFYRQAPRPAPKLESARPLLELIALCSDAEKEILMSEYDLITAIRSEIVDSLPQVVIAFMDVNNVRTLAATRDLRLPVIVSEHSDPFMNGFSEGRELLRRRLYPQARYLVALTEDVIGFLGPIAGGRGRVIPNAVEPVAASVFAGRQANEAGHVAMAMGRLSHEKGFAILLEAFAAIAEMRPDWRLEIWGEGPLRGELEELTAELGLAGRVSFPGFTDCPSDVMRRADLFVVSSLCEGWCNVLAEAMACGRAVVSFDCPSGPRNIIRNGIDGVLVPAQDVSAMASALDAMMGNEAERKRLASRAPEVLERFSLEKIMSMWDELVRTAALSPEDVGKPSAASGV
jgi:GalNAc-alpha-(1->4)-GalNAc-alpha-(1->3)-diNAcBac-PP-undecaprenol alpha-1,4-N-acetyl-D-galactosaminyltransferase